MTLLNRLFDPRVLFVLFLLALGLLGLTFVVTGDSGGSNETTPTPGTPTLPPVTATGTIGYITPDGNFALMNADGTGQRLLTQDGGVTSFAWAPDGSLAAVAAGTGPAARVRGITPDGSVAFEVEGSAPLWAPAGGRLAVIQGVNIAVVDSAGTVLRTFENGTLPAWAPDGSRLAFLKVGDDQKAVPVIGDVNTGEETPLSADIAPAEPVYPIAWHPSGDVIGYRNRLYDLSNGTTTDIPGTAVYWSPDGRVLLAAGEYSEADRATPGLILDATQEFKQTIGISIRPSAQDIPAQLFIQKWTDWSPDGRYLYYMDPEPGRERIRIYNTVPPVSQEPRKGIRGERPDISPDGQTLAFMHEGKVMVYPLDGSTGLGVPVAEGTFPAWKPGLQAQ